VQQVGTPTDIYDRPANTFVASFIGSPAMNLLEGQISGGTFTGQNVSIGGLSSSHEGKVTLGFRAEDATLDSNGTSSAPLYSLELLGDATIATLKMGGTVASIRAAKDYRAEIGDQTAVNIPPDVCHIFDANTGERLD
jgi:multiple sugar transport system ATP-binding protein